MRIMWFLVFTSTLVCEQVSITADALYWRVSETLDWALTLNPDQNKETVTFQTFDGVWNPGFRVGLSYARDWDTSFTYTYYRSYTKEHGIPGNGGIQSAFLGAKISSLGTYDKAKASWEVHYDTFDWEFGYPFKASDSLFVRPFTGLKGAIINQKIRTGWEKEDDFLFLEIPIKANEKIHNDFWGVGPQFGVDGKWTFAKYKSATFSLVGDFGAALLWGHWDIQDRYRADINILLFDLDFDFQENVITRTRSREFGAFMVHGLLGFGFELGSHFSMKVGYELEDWFDNYQGFDNATGAHNNDLLFQGATFHLQAIF